MKRKKSLWKTVLGACAVFLVLGVDFAAGYGLSTLILRFAGAPSEMWMHVISGILGFLLFIITVTVIRLIMESLYRSRHGGNRQRHMFGQHEMLKNTLDALERIARGDFTVLVPIDGRDPYSELAESVNKMARELDSMESLRQDFISNVSHEIQSPLTSISGFAALLKNDQLLAEQRMHYINIIEAESKRLSSLSDHLLKLSALETGNEPMNLKEHRLDKQLENIALMLEPQWNAKNISVEAKLEKVTIDGDESLLSQVWINLLHNAIKFTAAGGKISITLSGNGAEAVCRISDNGIGIANEDKIHIFERFYKVDKARERSLGGNGLGLPLVKKIVELHGGRIEVNSEIGKGTAFLIYLPRLHSV